MSRLNKKMFWRALCEGRKPLCELHTGGQVNCKNMGIASFTGKLFTLRLLKLLLNISVTNISKHIYYSTDTILLDNNLKIMVYNLVFFCLGYVTQLGV